MRLEVTFSSDAPSETVARPVEPATQAADGDAAVSARRRRWVLAATSLGAFVAFLDATIVNIAFPSIQSSFHEVARSWLSWVLNAYNIIFAALLLPAGRIADLVGRKRVFALGLGMFGLASLLCAAAPSAAVLVALRAVQAVGAALLVPTSLGLLLDEYPVSSRVQGIAVLGSAAGLAAASGPVFGGVLVNAFGWRAVFLVNVPVCVYALFLTLRWVREQRDTEHGRVSDVLGIVLFTFGMGLIALSLTRADAWGWGDLRVGGSLAAGLLLLAAFVRRSLHHPAPAIELWLFKLRSVRMANCAIIVFAAAFFAKILIDVLFLTSIWHYSVLLAGAAMTPGPLITAILAAPAGRLATRFGAAPVAAAGALVYAVGCAWYAIQAGDSPHYLTQWLPGAGLTGVGIAMAFPSLTSAAVISLPATRYATGSALNAAARQFGGVLGIAIAVSIIGGTNQLAPHRAFVHAWLFAAVSAALAAAVALTLGLRREPAVSMSRS